ncbi:unnamed protein product [Phytomonas sp. Hart1]|nr:unnamed protein product [Phytomonas sp. Hart1]|eukprot:CCW68277.1 unnamed protein product [Phytomonas sp. isolate Hart1]
MFFRNLKRCSSGKQWAQRQALDPFVIDARRKGYISRSAFKLLYLDDRYGLFHRRKTRAVIDLGCSPGGWCQVIRERTGDACMIFGVDILNVKVNVLNAVFVQGDFKSIDVQKTLLEHLNGHKLLPENMSSSLSATTTEDSRGHGKDICKSRGKVDVIVSDMCPNREGGAQDRHRISALDLLALKFSLPLLKEGGHFVCKVLGSPASYKDLHVAMQRVFQQVHINKPSASRMHSDESFLVGHSMLKETSPMQFCENGIIRPNEGRFNLDNWPGFMRTQEYRNRKKKW